MKALVENKILNIVIPMAGRGSRFSDSGFNEPKPFISIFGRTMIELVVSNLRPKTPHRFIFVVQETHVGPYGLEAHLSSIAPGCEIIQLAEVTDGAAVTVLAARDLIDNAHALMIANSDQYIDYDIDEYLNFFTDFSLDGLIMTMKADGNKWSYVKQDESGRVVDIKEKIAISNDATVGIYNFSRGADFVAAADKMISLKEKQNGEYYVAPTYNYLPRSAKVRCFHIGEVNKNFFGLGTPADLHRFMNFFGTLK